MLILKIKLISPDLKLIEFNKKLILFFLKKKNIKISSIKMPEKFKNFVLLRSPHVFKKSKKHYSLYNKSCVLIVKTNDLKINYYLNFILKKIDQVRIELNYKEE